MYSYIMILVRERYLIRKIKDIGERRVDRIFLLTIFDYIKNHLVPFTVRARGGRRGVSNSVDRVISMEIFGGEGKKKSRFGRRPTSATVF